MLYNLISWVLGALSLTRSSVALPPLIVLLPSVIMLCRHTGSMFAVNVTMMFLGPLFLGPNAYGRLLVAMAFTLWLVENEYVTTTFAILYISAAFSQAFHLQKERLQK